MSQGHVKLHHAAENAVKTVLVPVAEGTEEIEAVTIVDTLARAGANVVVASVGSSLTVTCSRGVKLTADCLIGSCAHERWDLIACPGGLPGAQHLSDNELLVSLLKRQAETGKHYAAICAAPALVLARHGLLDGKTGTCYPASKFTAMIDRYVSQKVVEDGNVITSQGPATALAFSLKLVEALYGAEKAEQIRNDMLA
eukprot:gene1518-1654_t